MKSRVQKNQPLYRELLENDEEKIENSDLSHFANRLNQIDSQFKKMEIPVAEDHNPMHARIRHTTNFDTIESQYLKSFLDEVRQYNVKKGYTDDSDNSTPSQSVDEQLTQAIAAVDPSISEEYTDLYEPQYDLEATAEDAVSPITSEHEIAQAVRKLAEDKELSFAKASAEPETTVPAAEEKAADDVVDALLQGDAHEKWRETNEISAIVPDEKLVMTSNTAAIATVRKNRLLNSLWSLLILAIIVVVFVLIYQVINM